VECYSTSTAQDLNWRKDECHGSAARSARGVPWSRCFVLQTSGESVLLQVEHADMERTNIKPMYFFIKLPID